MAAAQQLRLLLWKDYLIRKRKVITLAGVVWATAVILSLYIVRINVDNQDFPTCQFPARALPSAGLLTFLQSFMCSVNNECSPLQQFDEIPTYEDSKLTQLQRKLAPILNDSVLDVASSVPDALKLLATLADVVDVPAFVELNRNGLKVRDLFTNPARVKRLVAQKLELDDDVLQNVLDADLSFQGILEGDLNKCSRASLSKTLLMVDMEQQLNVFVKKLCTTPDEVLQKIFMDLLFEVNYSKYMAMLGQMYYKLAADNRITTLGDMLSAILRMTKLDSFLPPELISIFQRRDIDFSYIHLDLLPNFMNLFGSPFGDTQSYQSMRGIVDTVVVGLRYLDKIASKGRMNDTKDAKSLAAVSGSGLQAVSNVLHNAADVLEETMKNDSSMDTYIVFAQITNFIYKFLPEDTKHDVIFYSTLLAKLMESAQKVVDINMHIEELTYNVTLRHPKTIQVLQSLPPFIIGKAFDALTIAERTQILTSKINYPSQMLCDTYKLQTFFLISKAEAESVKKILCTDTWKNYVSDLIKSFGVFEAKNNINSMTTLLIQRTLGKDTSDNLYTIDQDFKILKNFSKALIKLEAESKPKLNWNQLLNTSDDSEFMKVVKAKGHLGKQMLIVVHGALAKEIVQQNPILDYKISPYLVDVTNLVSAMNKQLLLTPESVTSQLKSVYPDIIKSMLMTALHEEKTYKALSNPGQDIFCNGVDNADNYLELSANADKDNLVKSMCDATVAIENGLMKDSFISKAIHEIINSSHSIITVDWTNLINNLKDLYVKLEKEYPYIFEFHHYGMDKDMQKDLEVLFNDAKEYWFGLKNMERSLHISVKLMFKFLDILDTGLFDITGDIWLKIKFALLSSIGPLSVLDESVKLVTALITNQNYTSDLPPSTVKALTTIVPNIPQLTIDAVDIILHDNTEIQPIISLVNADPPWPCSTGSLSELLTLSDSSKEAVKGLETLFCLDRDFQEEWMEYLAAMNATIDKSSTWNNTEIKPHVFLKFSGTFDALVEDVMVIRGALDFIANDTSRSDHVGYASAWEYAVNSLNRTDRNVIMGKAFRKADTILNSVNTSTVPTNVSVSYLWEQFFICSKNYIEDDCKVLGRAAWKYSLKSLSVMFENVASDLMTYFTEVREPDANILQVLGFTRRTGLHILYDKMGDFMAVLLNSYWDYGFMSQIRRASLSQFWDCEAVVAALLPPPGSVIDKSTIKKVQPFVCPSLLHWLSLPINENTLLDVFAKPQYFFYVLEVRNLSSNFETAFTNAIGLADYLTEMAKKNQTLELVKEDVTLNTIKDKFTKVVDTVLSYRVKETDPSYVNFSDIIKNQVTLNIYVTRIVTMVNKLSESLNNLNIDEIVDVPEEGRKKLEDELYVVKNIFKRRPLEAVNLHFDILTDLVWMTSKDENYTLVKAIEKMCNDLKTETIRNLLEGDSDRTKKQICAKKFDVIYGAVQLELQDDLEQARVSLDKVIGVLTNDSGENVTDVFQFFNEKPEVISSIQSSVKTVYDLSLPIYVKYLQSNMQSYNIILKFLSGEDWWTEMTMVYSGPYALKFFGYLEQSFEVVEDILTNLDEIHVVRLLHDIEVNQTETFCLPNITLSDYFPDRTGFFSELKRQLCVSEKAELFKELPPLLFASQGYDNSLKLSRTINYTVLNENIEKTNSLLGPLSSSPSPPQRPPWVTEEKLRGFRAVVLNLLSKESTTKASFAVLSNGVDVGTLFLNSSHCTLCSEFTTWFKQLNLQLYKKQEYDSLLCNLQAMTLEDIHYTLKNNFHWDMMLHELISTRNYTKYEMNKSMNDFLGLVKANLLEDITSDSTKLAHCLARNISRNELGNATLLVSVVAHTAKLLRAELPHIHEVDGMKDIRYLKELSNEVAHNMDVMRPLQEYLVKDNDLSQELVKVIDDDDIANDILDSQVNLRKLPKLQMEEFWRFAFISELVHHVEDLVSHGARLLGVASKVDLPGVLGGKLNSLLDTLMLLLTDETVESVLYSLQGVTSELHPVLQNTDLEHDLEALAAGLRILHDMKNYMLENLELKLEVSRLFPDQDALESGLGALGINNTNFWSIAAPRIRAGHFQLKPILSTKQDDSHIANFVCQMDSMSRVILPSNLDVVAAEDVYAAVIDQFCGLSDERVKEILPVLLRNFNFTVVMDKVASILLEKLYSASNLTQEEGATVLSKFRDMAALVPVIQDKVGDVAAMFREEPLFKSLQGFSSVNSLLSSSDFMASAGQMMCGKPFEVNLNRMYKTIAAAQDFTREPDQAQLDVLPTDFCRDLYKDIVNMEGGKIVWSFVKPLIMGKILYTPASPAVTRIIEKANATFSTMIKMTNLVHSFARSFPAVGKLASHRAGVGVLRRVLTSPQLSQLRAVVTGAADVGSDVEVPDVDVDELLDQFGDLKGIGDLLHKASELLRCVNLDRFKSCPGEPQLTHEAAELSFVNEFSAGLVFLNSTDSLTNVEYKIRMDVDNAPTTVRLKDYLWVPGPEASFIENMRYFRGFIQIQDLVDQAIIELSRDSSRTKRELRGEEERKWAVYTQQEPYPCYRKDFFQTTMYESQVLLVGFFFALLFTVASAVRFIVSDKETGNTILMSVMGVDLRWHTLSWAISSFLELVVTCACITVVLHTGRILPKTDPTLIFGLLFIFGISVLSFCYVLSKLFQSASMGAVCGAIVYLMSFMPFVLILSLEAVLDNSLKLVVCLSMSSSLCYAFLYITRYEAHGTGAHWAQLWESPSDAEDMGIGVAAIMMLVDAAIYMAIGYLIDKYYGIKTLTSNITHCTTTDEKAGVSIVNVTKIYDEGSRKQKVALDNVSIELHKGQITTLLGHNGAGKTTLIQILTGMLKPTKGHVIVRSEHSGTRLGVCPQKDVLFEYMTAKEHIMLYAQLKTGRSATDVQDEVDKMLKVLCLGPVCLEPVVKLSGGTRRRLCVALAFIGQPHLVSLDEPTAGVDPAARRDIWSIIAKLKEDRTVLLTTHHLDEAELLSDQIVIMHKGQIHTTGSPIEIKRTLGNGYKLTVMYPEKEILDNGTEEYNLESWQEEISLEEKTKQLLAVVRDVIKNANLMDINGFEVEILLPFFDANGLNNNFLQLCTVLEASQSTLGFRNFTLDCSSLEQVFFNICQQVDAPQTGIEYVSEDFTSKSASSSTIRTDRTCQELVSAAGPLRGTVFQQFLALMHARYIHHIRNRWLLFMLIGLPMIFIAVAMGFSMLRPPADNEVSLKLDNDLYGGSTEYIVPQPTIYSPVDSTFTKQVMRHLQMNKKSRNWSNQESPSCKCLVTHMECDIQKNQTTNLPQLEVLPDVDTLNNWLVDTQEIYIEKRYGGYSSVLKNNISNLVAWYNNKGHHAMPAYLNSLNNAILRTVAGNARANITTYTHPLKISKEQISKATVYQHIADAGISSLVLVAYCLVSAGSAIYLVGARQRQEKRLQLLCGVSPMLYWTTALAWDMMIMAINIGITAIIMLAFGFPVFVARSNLAAICLLFVLYGYACASLVHLTEKLFTEASMANMVLFCGNVFIGLSCIAILLIMDIISESEKTDNARIILHKIFLLAPQFALGDGLLEIAKNTIQALVLNRFGMDTYKDPFNSSLVLYHYIYLFVVGTVFFLLNLAIEYDYFEVLLVKFRSEHIPQRSSEELEPLEVSEERRRVRAARLQPQPLRVNTIGNINRGFVVTESKKNSIQRVVSPAGDAAQCVELGKVYPGLAGSRVALRGLTLGIPPGQCTALLGENGAGKSTTFAMLTGEVRPSEGQIYLNNRLVNSRQLCQGLISYCPQSNALDPLLSVRETLAFYCQLRGIDEQKEVIRRTLEMFDLTKYSDVCSGTLSGGNKRKLCTAIAFMARTPLVLLDEPTSGMDPVTRSCVSRGVRAARAARRGVLLSTHALEDARRLAARVALLRAGRLRALAGLEDCLTRFGGGYVVSCHAGRAGARVGWARVRLRAAHAVPRVLHRRDLHFLLPIKATVNQKEITTRLSDVFRLMAELQSDCDIEDYTVNQSSLEQMFLSFSDKEVDDQIEIEPLPSPETITKADELDSITSL